MPGEPGSPPPVGRGPPAPASSVTPAPVHPPGQSAALLAVSAASAASASSASSHRLITLSSAVAPHCGRGPGRGPPRPPPPSPAAGAPSDARARARARGRRAPAGGREAWSAGPGNFSQASSGARSSFASTGHLAPPPPRDLEACSPPPGRRPADS